MVMEDNTAESRKSWQRIYLFKDCSKEDRKSLSCKGEYGWALDPGIYLNLFDRNYFTFGIDESRNLNTKSRQLTINDSKFDFVMDLNKKTLIIIQNDKTILSMRKVRKSEIRADL